MKESTTFKQLDDTAMVIDLSTVSSSPIFVGLSDEPHFNFSGGLKGVFFRPKPNYTPSTPSIYLAEMEIRNDKVVCTYITSGVDGMSEILRAASIVNATKTKFGVSGTWIDESGQQYLGSFVVTSIDRTYLPLGDKADNVFVVVFLYEHDLFLKP
jgi:hypothetical protein